jgi:type VI secretion system protein ImpC
MAKNGSPDSIPRHKRFTFERTVGAETVERELPFVLGVLDDLAGDAGPGRPHLDDRWFLDISRDTFDEVLSRIAPRLDLQVENRLVRDDSLLRIELNFRNLSDFEPMGIVRQVPSLQRLLDSKASGAVELLSAQVDAILHAPAFRKLEAAWRGLHYLALEIVELACVRLRVLDISRKELQHDVQKSASFDRSVVFRKIRAAEQHTVGGEPFGTVILNHEIGSAPEDIQLLRTLARVAAAAHSPFLAPAAPGMFGCGRFAELYGARNLYKTFQSPAYAAWRSFREDESARYFGLTLPGVLLRPPYLSILSSPGGLLYDESAEGDYLLWGSLAYVLAAKLADTYARTGWFEGISGFAGESLIRGLPTAIINGPEGTVESPTEIPVPGAQAKEFAELGFITLGYEPNTREASFFAASCCAKPARYTSADATANARNLAQLQNISAAAHVVRQLEALLAENRAHSWSVAHQEEFLNAWIQRFVVPEELIGQEAGDSYPLADAWIEVRENPRQRGQHLAVVSFQPHISSGVPAPTLQLSYPLESPR